MKKLALPLLLLLLFAGCLEFDAQEITLRYDPEADRIDAHFVYRGLFAESGSGSSDRPLEKAVKDLDEVLATGEFFLWCNWPLRVDLTVERPAPLAALMAHVEVENGSLFTDPRGVLCAHQFVRVNGAKAFVQKVNTLFELFVQQQLLMGTKAGGASHAYDDETRDFVREFLRAGEKFLVLEPGRIELRLPLSAKDHAWAKEELERHVITNLPREVIRRFGVEERRAAGGDAINTSVTSDSVAIPGERLKDGVQRAPSYRFLWDNDVSIQRELERTTVGLGVRGAPELTFKRASGGLYHDTFMKALRERGDTIEDGLPDQELVRRFEAFRGRDAKLPPKLAEKRAAGAAAKTK